MIICYTGDFTKIVYKTLEMTLLLITFYVLLCNLLAI